MKASNKLLIAIPILLCFLITPQTYAAENLDPEAQSLEWKVPPGAVNIQFNEANTDNQSVLFASSKKSKDAVPTVSHICKSITDPRCVNFGTVLTYTSILSPCSKVLLSGCIDSVWAIPETSTAGKKISGALVSEFQTKTGFPESKKYDIPQGGATSIWSIPGGNLGGSELFSVTASVTGGATNFWKSPKENPCPCGLSLSIQPVRLVTGWWHTLGLIEDAKPFSPGFSPDGGLDPSCAAVQEGECAQKASFTALGTRYGITFRLSKQVGDRWFAGRLDKPTINIQGDSKKGMLYSIEGNPMQVPYVSVNVDWNNIPKALKSTLTDPAVWNHIQAKYLDPAGNLQTDTSTGTLPSFNFGYNADEADSVSRFAKWLPLTGEIPYAMKTYWNLRSIWDLGNTQQCVFSYNPYFVGLVTTNAVVYTSGPPTLSAGSLAYKVGATHFKSTDTAFPGEYNLVMRSDVARCLYKLDKTPVQGSVVITSDNGRNDIATVVTGEKSGWVYLSASNFHYSINTIRVKLAQKKK